MRKTITAIIALAFISSSLTAQLWKLRRLEWSIGPGITQLNGDIGGFGPNDNWAGFRDVSIFSAGLYLNTNIRYRLTHDLNVRADLNSGFFHSTDRWGSNITRRYSEMTIFFEPDLLLEFSFIKNKMENDYLFIKGKRSTRHSFISTLDFYAFGGIGALGFSIFPNDKLSPDLMTSNGFIPVIPVGIGVSRSYPKNLKSGVEFSGRYTSSDFIDGYSSALTKNNDVYYFLNFSFTWKLRIRKFPKD